MKIVRLNLDAFGPFAGEWLDLSTGRQGLHLVYGANEAGKTSSLRAIGNLLYGIPIRSTDNFRFDHNKMRLSAILEHSDGSRLEFVRHKRNKNPLCQADGETPLDPAQLDRFLGGVDASMFETMFGIGHEALIRGGKEIINGGGKLGELLFSASSGIADLKGIQDALQADRLELFTDMGKGKNQRIPLAIAEVNEARAKTREATVTTEEWTRQERAVREARDQSERLDQEHRSKSRQVNRLKRIRGALKLFPERAQLLEQLEPLARVVLLDEDFADRRRKAESKRDHAALDAERAREMIEGLKARLDAIEVPEPLLSAEEEIEALHGRRGEYRKAQTDRPLRARDLQEHEHRARDYLQELGRPRDLAEADSFQIRADDPVVIQQLALRAEKLATRREENLEAIARHRRRSEKLQAEREAQEPPSDLGALRAAVKGATSLGDLEARRAEALHYVEPREKALKAALRRLPQFSGTTDELEDWPVPMAETVTRFEAEFQATEVRRLAMESDRLREEKAIAEGEARLLAEARGRDLPTEDDLSRSRRTRDEGWNLVRRSWLDHRDDPEASAAFVAGLAPGRTLADAFEQAVARSDTLADRLRREAEEVARRAEQRATLDAHRAELARIARDEAAAREARDRLAKDWEAVTSPMGLSGSTPAEVRGWLDRREKVLECLGQVRASQIEVKRLDRQSAEQTDRLSAALEGLGLAPASPGERLAELIERAQGLIKKSEAEARRRERLEADLAEVREGLGEAERGLARIESDFEDWRALWGGCMTRVGLEPDATPEQANVFLGKIRDLREQITKAKSFRSRIQGIDRDGEQFTADVAGLVERIAPDLAGQPPDLVAETLQARLRAAREDDQSRRSLRERLEAEEAKIRAAERSMDEARLELVELCRQAECSSVEELPLAERRSDLCTRLEADLKRCEDQIRALSAGATIEAFLEEAGRLDPDGLDEEIAGLDEEISGLHERMLEVNQTIGAEEQVLRTINGGSKATEAREQEGPALARLQTDVPRYAALRIAAYVLQQGIERYRERSQGPLIRRASELFATLTAGSFGGLRIDSDDKGTAVLVGLRPDGETSLGISCMSDGSSDQLYLALRLASLESWLAAHEPIPLIVDDILLQFDDARSLAALRVLAELSTKTQVIFFTHHLHLVELARANLDAGSVFVHQLPSGRAIEEAPPPPPRKSRSAAQPSAARSQYPKVPESISGDRSC